MSRSTEGLIANAQEGDRSAWSQLIKKYESRLEGFVRSRLGPGLEQIIDVEDVAQEAFLKALESLHLFNWRGEESFLHWLNRIALNVINETARREKRSLIIPLTHDVSGSDPTQSQALRRRERFDRLKGAIATLPADYRQVILLARIERLPMKDVAQKMERSPEATTQLLWRAMKQLKTIFGETDSLHLPSLRLEFGGESHGK